MSARGVIYDSGDGMALVIWRWGTLWNGDLQ